MSAPQDFGKLTVILGPMYSGKTRQFTGLFDSIHHAGLSYRLFQPASNTRDADMVQAHDGSKAREAFIATSLTDVWKESSEFHTIGVEEFHMFANNGLEGLREVRERGINVIVCGLNADYRGRMFPIVIRLLEQGADSIEFKKGVCSVCKKIDASLFSQMLINGKEVTGGEPVIAVEGAKRQYEPRCPKCFVFPE